MKNWDVGLNYEKLMLNFSHQVPPTLTARPARKNCSPKAPDKKPPPKLSEKEQPGESK